MSSQFIQTFADTTLHLRITRPSTGTTKPLLVFLHYWGGSSSTWHKLLSPSSATSLVSDYPTAAIDLRGWGKSTGPTEDTGDSYSITTMASDIGYVLSQLKADAKTSALLENGFVFVGHSMGAKVSLATLSTLSSSILETLKGLVLVAPAPPTALVLPTDMKDQQKAAYTSEDSIRWIVANVLANTGTLTAEDLDMIVRDSLSGNLAAKTAWPAYAMGEDITEDVKSAIAPLAKRIRVRVLAGELDVVEQKDRVRSQVCEFLEGLGVDVNFRVVEGVKHLIPLEGAGVVREETLYF
ncbi:Alpha/Beta hydrolase protein [Aspergillus californicus]